MKILITGAAGSLGAHLRHGLTHLADRVRRILSDRSRWHELPDEQLRIKTAILNAYYFPDEQYEQLGDEITPVNSFRVLFNALFETDFEILPDRTYVSPDDRHLYEFHDVTDRVRRLPELAEGQGTDGASVE